MYDYGHRYSTFILYFRVYLWISTISRESRDWPDSFQISFEHPEIRGWMLLDQLVVVKSWSISEVLALLLVWMPVPVLVLEAGRVLALVPALLLVLVPVVEGHPMPSYVSLRDRQSMLW
jgi:hypothetical protein